MEKEQAASVDPFGLDADMDVDSNTSQLFAGQQQQQEEQRPATISKEFNFDGQLIRIEASSPEELLERALAAKDQYYQSKLSESQYMDEGYETPADYEIPELSAEEEQIMALNWTANPSGHIKRVIEANLGIPFEQFKKEFRDLQDFKTTIYLNKIGAEFADRHSQDYYPSQDNARRLVSFLQRTGRDFTPENYEFAFANLRNELTAPPEYGDADGSMSTALSASYGNASYDSYGEGMSVDDLAKKYEAMPLAELEKLINSRGR